VNNVFDSGSTRVSACLLPVSAMEVGLTASCRGSPATGRPAMLKLAASKRPVSDVAAADWMPSVSGEYVTGWPPLSICSHSAAQNLTRMTETTKASLCECYPAPCSMSCTLQLLAQMCTGLRTCGVLCRACGLPVGAPCTLTMCARSFTRECSTRPHSGQTRSGLIGLPGASVSCAHRP